MNYISRLRKPLFTRNVAVLRSFGGYEFKLTRCWCIRTKGVELPDGFYKKKGSVNDKKLMDNIARARSRVRELGLCNPFDMFITVTVSPEKYDRYNLKKFHKDFAHWIRNYNQKHGIHIKYIFIPEKHENGAWHEHGLLMGLPFEHLTLFTLEDHLPYYIRDKLKAGMPVYNWPAYAKKFGFVDIEPIRSKGAAVNYITKYITKDMNRSVSDVGAHLYYASQGLQRSQEIERGTLVADIPADFENEYCKINWFSSQFNTAEELKDLFTEQEPIHDDD